jgi:RNA polymerase sigma factor (sigma-70 family)
METSAIATRSARRPRISVPLLGLGDERLARMVAVGDGRAFALLYERYHQRLYRYLRSMLRQDADAQDALQSVFASAFAALKAGRRNAPLRPWLFRIAHNEAVSLLRRSRSQDELAETLVSPAPSPEEQAAERQRLRLLVADLTELSDRQRGALVMRELSGLAHEDIACALEMSVGAAKQSVFEARRALMEFAEGRAMACEDIQRVVSDGDKRALRGRRVRAHIRSCPACAAFGVSIESRRADLLALSPALPAASASALFARATGTGFGQGGGGGGLIAGITSKTAGVALSGKVFTAGVAVLATAAIGAAGVLPQITASPGSVRSGPKATLDRRSGQDAAGASTASARPARLRDRSVTTGLPRIHEVPLPGAAQLTSAASPSGIATGGRGAMQTRASSAPGRIVSQSNGAAGGSRAHPVSGRLTAATHARGPASSGTRRSINRSAGVTHRVSKPARTAPAGRPFGSLTPRHGGQSSRSEPSMLPGSRASSVSGAPSLASSRVGNLAAAARGK